MVLDLNWDLLDYNDVEQGNLGEALTFWYVLSVFLYYPSCGRQLEPGISYWVM